GTLPKLVEETEILGDLHVHLATFDRAAVDAAVRQAHELHWAYLGLAAPPERIDELRSALPSPADVKLFIGVELEATVDRHPPSSADYVILTASGASVPRSSGGPDALLLAHLSTGPLGGVSDIAQAGGWLSFARARGAAIELTAQGAADGVDAGQARAHQDAGGFVHLTAP